MPSSTTEIEHLIECLEVVQFCQGLDQEQLAAIARDFSVRTFAAGDSAGDADDFSQKIREQIETSP